MATTVRAVAPGLPALDEHGMPAFCCAADGTALVPAPDDPSVLRCPTCGHRTDLPGDGTLADGFDITHRQWGARGDVHAWRAMREALATTPTPVASDTVRASYVEGLRRVADVDLGRADTHRVYRGHLDHGGMGGGTVDADWWRDKGIPLLVERATARRPKPSGAARIRRLAATVAVWAVVVSIPAITVGAGSWLLYERASGQRVAATVLSCDPSGHFRRFGTTFREDCVAEWTIDGRTVIGNYTGGGGASDVGKTVSATVRGDTATSRSLVLPLVLIALGLPFAVILVVVSLRGRRTGR